MFKYEVFIPNNKRIIRINATSTVKKMLSDVQKFFDSDFCLFQSFIVHNL